MDFPELHGLGGKVNKWQKEETRHFLSLPKKSYILSLIAFLGICTTFLPWADVIVGFYARAQAVGLHFFFGWLIFLVFASVIATLLFNKYLKLQENVTSKVPKYGAVVVVALSAGFILWHLFDVKYGSYLCMLLSAIFLSAILFYDKIMHGK
jgi:hypothetical protein